MQSPPIPKDEQARLASLHELQLLDDYKHKLFEGAADLAAEVFGASIALVSLVDTDRQWFAAKHNFEANETPRDISFCGHAIVGRTVMIVPDARLDSRFRDNPLVISPTPVVFYAGAPLITPDNLALGTLCVIDHEPKYPSERQVRSLEQLAKFVVDQMELRRGTIRQQRIVAERERELMNQSRRLHDIATDLRTALGGIVRVSTQLIEKSTDPEIAHGVASLRYSATSLVQIVDQLSSDTILQMNGKNLTLSSINPLMVSAAALSAFNAESERRGVQTSISSEKGANVTLFTDQERLRLCLFHGVGFLLAQLTNGDLSIRLEAGQSALSVRFVLTATGELEAHDYLKIWAMALDGEGEVHDLPLVHSLFSMRQLCTDLQGYMSLDVGEQMLSAIINLPVSLSTKARQTAN